MKKTNTKKVHFIGIGGIGVSALAKYYKALGWQVSGSDLVSSEITDALKQKGTNLYIGKHHSKNLPPDADLVIFSPAVHSDNKELKRTKELGIRCLSYPQAIGELTKNHFTIAVCGTHGKSTTSSMVGLLLTKAGLDPTVIIGTKLKEFGDSNCRVGKSKYLVIEADEHFASFLNYWPKIIVLTNVEADHLDYYKNLKNYIFGFKKFISHLPKDGTLVVNNDDKNSSKFKNRNQKLKLKTKSYSLKQSEAKKLRKILAVPGEHNVSNALATLAVAKVLKITDRVSLKALSEYKGSWRRFEEKIVRLGTKKLKLISDYGHHPTEIAATLQGARTKYFKKKIWLVYQPHQYQRTFYLFKDFVKVFRKVPADRVIITDIYDVAGREDKKIKQKVSSEKLVKAINKKSVIYLPKAQILKYLKKNLQDGEVLIIMGAGDIYSLTKFIK